MSIDDEVDDKDSAARGLAVGDKFKLASEVLLDNFDNASKIMKKIGNAGDITQTAYRSWPLFTDFRKTELFKSTYKFVFDEDFSIIERPLKYIDEILKQLKERSDEVKNSETIDNTNSDCPNGVKK